MRYGLARIDLINGATPISERQAIVDRFQADGQAFGTFDMPVLGPKAADTGMTLTAANHVMPLSRWWNPAGEEQGNDRAHRPGRTITVRVPPAVHPGYGDASFDWLLQSPMTRKQRLAAQAIWPMGETGDDAEQLRTGMGSAATARGDLDSAMAAFFARDGLSSPVFDADGSIALSA